MNRTCTKCTDQELSVSSANVFRHGVEALKSIVKVEVDYVCPSCGQKSGEERAFSDASDFQIDFSKRGIPQTTKVNHCQARLSGFSSDRRRLYTSVQFPAAFLAGENVLFPTFEGNIQDGTVINQYGDPDLMLEFTKQYFELYRSIMPTCGLPNSLVEMMSALHLLVVAAELALKACLIRSDEVEFGHSLQQLYDNLECTHRTDIELRFAESNLNKNLRALGLRLPTVKAILGVYDNTYGGASKAYMEAFAM